jgi:ribosomal protein L16 Arg81 hydroxylase
MSIDFAICASDFATLYQEKKPLLMKGAVSAQPVSWRDVNQIFERSDVLSQDFKISCDGVLPKSEYVESYWDVGMLRHRLIKPVVYNYLRSGATLIANKIANEPVVNQFSRQVADFTGRQVVNSAYAAFGKRDSFRCHWDTRDVFAIQLIGRKRWIVYEPSLESPLFTQQSKDQGHLYPCPDTPYLDVILEAGDVFYLPRGWWHNPLPLGEPTFHLALGTFPAYTIDYVSWAMMRMPEVLAARRSLSCWESDQGTLASMGAHLDTFLNDPDNYRSFQDAFTGAIRLESPLAIELFGNPAANRVPRHSQLRLSAYRPYGLDDRYVIANGVRLNLDDQGARLIQAIVARPGVSVVELQASHADLDPEKLHQLITHLCHQDVLEITRG